MSVMSLAALVTLATIPPIHAIVWTVIRAWRHASRRARRATDADLIFFGSIAPAAVAVGVAVLVTLPAFVLFEPAGRNERPGLLMAVSAAVGAGYLLTVVARVLNVVRLSRRCTTTWMSDAYALQTPHWGLPAYAIHADYPVVAVAGVFRPRLLIDRRVLESCSAEELRAIAAHEYAHVKNQDNARRLLIAACIGSHSAAAQQWRYMAEVAADERAAIDPDRAVVLAGALIKIARLAAIAPAPSIPFSAIHDGGLLEIRVHRLLSMTPVPARNNRRGLVLTCVAVLVIMLAASGTQLLAVVHELIELLVRAQ